MDLMKGQIMSSRRVRANAGYAMPVLESLEPRMLLSAVSLGGAVLDPGLLEANLPNLIVDVPPVVRDHHPILRDTVMDVAAAIADLKAANPDADASALPCLGFARVTPEGLIDVTIRFDSQWSDILAALTASGFQAGAFRQSDGLAAGLVSYTDIYALAEVVGIRTIYLTMPGVTNTGDITSAGDGILKANDLRSLMDVDGTGVKVGVISDGADNWDNVNDYGDLPATITIDPVRGGLGNEGTAYPSLPPPELLAPDIRDYIVLPPSATDHNPVIRDDVAGMAAAIAELRSGDPAADLSALCTPGRCLVNEDGEIKIIVRFESNQQDILSDFTAAGFRAGAFHQSTGGTSGWVSYADLDALAEVTGVKDISFATPPIGNDDPVVSDGDGILKAADLRNLLGVDGSGVTVGVISNGVYGWQSVKADEELPAAFGTGSIDQYHPGYVDEAEGTAMLEIVHDLAPGATLFFSGPTDSEEMLDAIDWLVAQGCDIIVDDLSFLDQPFFDDSDVANAALGAIANDDVVYVSAAGNFADRHYQADFNGGLSTVHQFAAGEEKLPFLVGPDAVFGGHLQWSDQWLASGNNYDLYLYQGYINEYDEIEWYNDPVYASTVLQDGDDTPVESITLQNPYSEYYLLLGWQIEKVSGSGQELELYTIAYDGYVEQLAYYVPEDSIFGQAAAEGVVAVGAIAADDPNNDTIESFSSQGPSTVYTFPPGQNPVRTERDSLDVAGIDGVSTRAGDLGYFHEPFYGTSAAAPHIAAIAALLKQINPSLTPAEIVDLIGGNAYDLTAYGEGYDPISGHGRADALAIISAATDVPDLTTVSGTGVSPSDNITMLDNHDTGSRLTFTVDGTAEGAMVKVYANGEEIGWATGEEGSTDVTTDGVTDLTDGTEEITITAVQIEEGKLPSPVSTGLTITVDTEAPTVQSFTRLYQDGNWKLRPTTLDTITIGFSEEVYDDSATAGAALALYNISTSQPLSPSRTLYGQETDTLTWDFGELNLTSNAGWYRVTISGSDVKDIAGNIMGSDYVYGNSAPQNDMLLPILGDANLDGSVGYADLMILAANMGGPGRTWSQADFNYDTFVDASDYITLKLFFGLSVSR